MDYSQALSAVAQAEGMTAEQATALLDLLMSGDLAAEEGGEVLRKLAERGETPVELAAFVRGLLQRAKMVPFANSCADCCGTGGSGRSRFNVSTTAAVVVASCGIPVAKHGNKGSRRPNGSFDLLEALGVPLDLTPARQAELLEEFKLAFCFARAHHPAVGSVVPYRKAAGGRTIFNLAGPLANPAGADCQVVGVCDAQTADVVAQALVELWHQRAVVVTGETGWDEFVLGGSNRLLEISNGQVNERLMPAPQLALGELELPGGDAVDNVAIFHDLLAGAHRSPLCDLLALSAGALIDTWNGRAIDPAGEGVALASEAIASGRAQAHFAAFLAAAKAS